MKDHFINFKELSEKITSKSYKLSSQLKGPDFLLFTPHGGGIEPGTSEICNSIAKQNYSTYLFEGVGRNCEILHLTSTNFDEPQLLNMLAIHKYSISIHGMTNSISNTVNADIFLGGRNQSLIKFTTKLLKQQNFEVVNNIETKNSILNGTDKSNVTNMCIRKKGMQIEISDSLRNKFFEGNYKLKRGRNKPTKCFTLFCETIRQSILKFLAE